MATANVKMLQGVPLLEGATPEVLQGLAQIAVERRFDPGEVIFQEGSFNRDMYLIVEGAAEVRKGQVPDAVVLARRGPGEFFGEMALIEQKARFATLRATDPTMALEFAESDLNSVLLRQPELLYRIV